MSEDMLEPSLIVTFFSLKFSFFSNQTSLFLLTVANDNVHYIMVARGKLTKQVGYIVCKSYSLVACDL